MHEYMNTPNNVKEMYINLDKAGNGIKPAKNGESYRLIHTK